MSTATVVGAGPNGLAAAVVLAQAGVQVTVLEAHEEIGGGARSSHAILPGLLHDHCSAVHPMAAGSEFVRGAELNRHGLRWCAPDIDCVHPLDDGSAGVLHRSVQATAAGLGSDSARWRRLMAGPAASYDALARDIMRPLLRPPSHPLLLARFGLPTVLPATVLAKAFHEERTKALFGGVAAHAYQPLNRPLSSAIGLGILTAGHRHGWVVAAGGSASITQAMAARLLELGGKIETAARVDRAADLPRADITVFDLAPRAIAEMLGDQLAPGIARSYRRFRHGPGAFKVDFAVEGGVPWTAEPARRAGTVHLGGTFAEIVATERMVCSGQMPARPFVLVGQQYLADPQRSVGDVHPVWTYAHVPHGYPGDATEAIVAQIERFAPGFRDRVVGQVARSTSEFSRYNANYVGGDILTGAKDPVQLVLGPGHWLNPYRVGPPGMFICSAATPPGPGAHGMCGANAAAAALRHLRKVG